ncbi:hypothetical protein J6590_078862 [Homalodisca vitripennis]|nr:hypothetical protein J6590_078862 [Homalodisca vitripennis]
MTIDYDLLDYKLKTIIVQEHGLALIYVDSKIVVIHHYSADVYMTIDGVSAHAAMLDVSPVSRVRENRHQRDIYIHT